MRFVVFGDTHLRTAPWKRQVLGDAVYDVFSKAVNDLIEEHKEDKEDVVFFLVGDIVDKKHLDEYTIRKVQGCLKLVSDNFPLFYINGNHDSASAYGDGKGLTADYGTHMHKKLLTIGGKKVYGLDYISSSKDFFHELEGAPACDILCMHDSFKHLLGFEGSYKLDKSQVPEHIKHVAVGDIHVQDSSLLPSGGRVVSPGTIYPTSMGQLGPYGYASYDTETNEWSHVQVETHRVTHIRLDDEDIEVADVVEDIVLNYPNMHVQIAHTPDQANMISEIAEAVGDRAYIHSKRLPSEIGVDRIELEKATTAENVNEIIADDIRDQEEDYGKDECDFLADLWRASDIDKLLKERFGDLECNR